MSKLVIIDYPKCYPVEAVSTGTVSVRDWVSSLIDFHHTSQEPLSKPHSEQLFTVLNKQELPEQSKKTALKALGHLIPKADYIFQLLAAAENEDLVLELLDPDLIKKEGQNFLRFACRAGFQKVVETVLKSGHADINKADFYRVSSLTYACQGPELNEKKLKLLDFLLKSNANPNAQDEQGGTALMEIFQRKDHKNKTNLTQNLKAAQLLIDAGADVNIKNNDGKSLLEIVNDEESIRFLVKAGADIYVRHDARKNKTLLHEVLLDEPASKVAAFLNCSLEEAEKRKTDYKNRFLLGHYNSIETKPTDLHSYNSSSSTEQCAEMVKLLESLPAPFSSNIDPKEKQQLIDAFRLVSKETMDVDKLTSLIQDEKLVILPIGFDGHAIHLVFCNGYLTILNRGDGSPVAESLPFLKKLFSYSETVKAYKIDSKAVTKDIVSKLLMFRLRKQNREEALEYYYKELPSLLSPNADKKPQQDSVCAQLEKLRAKDQKIGNCAAAQAKLSTRFAKAMLAIKKDKTGKAELPVKEAHKAYAFSKDFSSHLRLFRMDRYLENHSVKESTADEGLLKVTYQKITKRLTTFPELSHYPNFAKWKQRLEAVWSQEFRGMPEVYVI